MLASSGSGVWRWSQKALASPVAMPILRKWGGGVMDDSDIYGVVSDHHVVGS